MAYGKNPPVGKAKPNKVQKNAFKKQKKTHKNRGFQVPRPIPIAPRPRAPLAISKNPYTPLPGPIETATMKISYIQFKLKNLVLLPLHSFLCAKGLACPTDVDIDMQDILRVIKSENIADPVGFLHLLLAPYEVDKAISVRNNIDHLDLTNIDLSWQTQLPAYVLLCQSVNESSVATEIQGIINQMVSGCLDGIILFSFQFTPGFTREKAFGLSQIVYGVLLEFLAKEIWTFLRSKLGINNITIDLYANLKYITDQLKVNADYIGPGGGSRGDAQLLKTAYDKRMDNAHGGFTRGSTNWRTQLDSVVQILDLINKHDVALNFQRMIDRLVRLETEEATVTNEEFKFME